MSESKTATQTLEAERKRRAKLLRVTLSISDGNGDDLKEVYVEIDKELIEKYSTDHPWSSEMDSSYKAKGILNELHPFLMSALENKS
jgi:hypothetical protein